MSDVIKTCLLSESVYPGIWLKQYLSSIAIMAHILMKSEKNAEWVSAGITATP